jgi:serine palmitoyltransferase
MLFEPGKIMNFTRECYKRGLAVVVVGFPAVPLVMSRARFCVSAAHTREQLDRAVSELQDVARICRIRYKLHDVKKAQKKRNMALLQQRQ